MTWLKVLACKLSGLFRKGGPEREMNEEIESHLAMQIEENLKKGMSPAEARLSALRSFGGVEQAKEIFRDQQRLRFVETLFQDLRYGLRTLAKNPGFTLVAILTLGLGIGANSTIFTVVNAALIHPLPFRDANRLVTPWGSFPEIGYTGPLRTCDRDYAGWRDQNQVFDQIGAYGDWNVSLTGAGDPVRLLGAQITSSLFPMLGVSPAIGRRFAPDEEQPAHSQVAILSDKLWRGRFHADTAILGRSVTFNNEPYIVVGVMPAGFGFPNESDFWTPIPLTNQCSNATLQVIGKLKTGITVERAQADISVISQRLDKDHGAWNIRVTLIPLVRVMGEDLRPLLLILLAAVGLVLLIACANVANLLLARAAGRQREIAVRSALGAGRRRIISQLLTESILLAVLGGASGLVLAIWGHDLLAKSISILPRSLGSPSVVARIASMGVDSWVLAFTLAISLLTGIAFGLAPAILASTADLNETLKESGRTASPSLGRGRLRNALVVGEIAASSILLIGAGLLVRSLVRLSHVDPGFDPKNVLSMNVHLPEARYQTTPQLIAFEQRSIQNLAAIPGIRAVGEVFGLPMGGAIIRGDITIEGQSVASRDVLPYKMVVAGDYFRALEIPLIEGRFFNKGDAAKAPAVAIISEGMARRFWPGQSALGHHFKPGFPNDPWCTIVGVVGDVKTARLNDESSLALYLPFEQAPSPFLMRDLTFVVRSTNHPLETIPVARRSIHSTDPELPVSDVATMQQLIYRSVAEPRFTAILVGIFAALALALACVGVYGVMSFAVTQRTHEIAVRLALGAERKDVVRLIVGRGLLLTAMGVLIGVAGALGLTRLLTGFLFGVRPDDPATFAVVSAFLFLTALLASYVPVRRATKVDPISALRCE